MPLSADTLVRLGVPRDKARRHLPHLRDAMIEFDITTQRRAECFLAQLMHESGTLQFFEEIASGEAYEGRRDLGNVKPGDGRRYKGRGPIQLTGRTNYRKAGEALGVDFEAKPKLVAMPRYGYRVAGWFWKSRGLNELADANRFTDITRRINGAATAGPPSHQTRREALRAKIAAHDVRPVKADRRPAKAKAKAKPRPRPHQEPKPTAARPAKQAARRSPTALIEQAGRLDARSDRALELAIRRGTILERRAAESGPLAPRSLGVFGKELGELAEAIGEMRGALAEATAANGNGAHPEAIADIAERLRQHDEAGDTLRAELAERLLTLEETAGGNGTPATTKAEPQRRPKAKRPPTLKLTTPLMKGKGVAALQRTINRQLATWDVDHRLKVDAEFGPETREAVRRVAYGLGLSTKALDQGVTPELRERILNPKRRTEAERERARKRKPWIRRLRRRHKGHGPAAAIAYARKHIGVKEDPGRPNRGRLIDKWNAATGIPLNSQAFWCGAFVNACLTASGLPPDRTLAWCPGIEARAKAGTGGWSWHSKPRPGDLALFTHGGVAGHVGIVERVEGKSIVTIEGNTSANGTSNNGYGVFRRRRPLPIRGFARPPYDR